MNIVFLDCTQNLGYQFSAGNTKVEMLAKGLKAQGDTVSVINGLEGSRNIKSIESKSYGDIKEVITYPARKYGAVLSFLNLPQLWKDLKRLRRENCKNILIIELQYIHIYHIYHFIAHQLGYKVVAISQEWLPTVKRRYWLQNVSAKLYAKTFGYGIDGIMPISEYIIKRIGKFKKPYIKTPILADYTTCTVEKELVKEQTFLYCAFAGYFRVIKFILDAYGLYISTTENPYSLTLVITGNAQQITEIEKYITLKGLGDKVVMKSRLPYSELLHAFRTSSALLIPLDPNFEQDEARFSQKIAEYLSSGTPIISNRVGEIKYYFKDRDTIILTEYSLEGFSEAFCWVQKNPDLANTIGCNGFELGKLEFNCLDFGKKLHDFFLAL